MSAATALVRDGELLFATEEERLNRIKHTNKAPLAALRAGLHHIAATASDIDKVAYYAN